MSTCDASYGQISYSFSLSNLAPSSHASAACQAAFDDYQAHKDSLDCSYMQTHHFGCAPTPVSVSVLTVAMQEAAQLGVGVQGDVGCSVDPTATQLAGWMALTPTDPDGTLGLPDGNGQTAVLGAGDGDVININTGNGNTLIVGDGLGDQISVSNLGDANTLLAGNGDYASLTVNTGDDNILWAGNGDGDVLTISTGSNNDMHAGAGAGDHLWAYGGDQNCLTVGDGAGDTLYVGSGTSNALTAGNGDGDILYVSTGDNNLMTAGHGDGDFLYVGTGYHNTLAIGDGAHNILEINTGDYNFLHAGDGADNTLQVTDGDFNALIAGNGAGDHVIVVQGDDNILAVGDGDGSVLQLGSGYVTNIGVDHGSTGGGDDNILLQGNGNGDYILLGGANFDTITGGHLGMSVNSGNVIVMGNGADDQAWGSLGDNNSYLTAAGNDLVHTGGGADFVYVDNHTETATPSDPYHLTSTDSLAQNLYADGGNDTFAIQGAIVNTYSTHHHWHAGGCYEHAITWDTSSQYNDSSTPSLGTTVMSANDGNGGPSGVEKYWVDGAFGNAVVTDFNSANGDRVMVGGVWDGTNSTLSSLGTVHTEYIHSAYDADHTGNVDLLITFTSGQTQGSITLIDFQPQDTGGTGGAEQFNNVTFTNAAAAESTLAHIFDFNQADNQAVTAHVASLAAANLILH